MAYIVNLFSPATWSAFLSGHQTVSGFRERQEGIAHERVHPGDIFVCYLTGLSRWCGVFEVVSEAYREDGSLYHEGDEYVIRFKVRPLVVLYPEHALPIHENEIWSTLSFTRGVQQNSPRWTSVFRKSLNPLTFADGEFLHARLERQSGERKEYPLSAKDKRRWARSMRQAGDVLSAPNIAPKGEDIVQPRPVLQQDNTESHLADDETTTIRESILMQAKVAEIGATMGFSVWVPNNDRARVLEHIAQSMHDKFLDHLTLAYNDDTLSTVRNIDVLWLRRNAMVRAFEIEHTTAIYSGLLRMADLLALQPNINIRLHIVAPDDRQRKVLDEIKRPAFSDLKLPSSCSFLSYTQIESLAALRHLAHVSDAVISDYEIRID